MSLFYQGVYCFLRRRSRISWCVYPSQFFQASQIFANKVRSLLRKVIANEVFHPGVNVIKLFSFDTDDEAQ